MFTLSSVSVRTLEYTTGSDLNVFSAGNLATANVFLANDGSFFSAINSQVIPLLNSCWGEVRDMLGQSASIQYTYYVTTTGSDTCCGTSWESAFNTVAHAISQLPTIVNATAEIYFSTGSWAETLKLYGFTGKAPVYIVGKIANYGSSVAFNAIEIMNCAVPVYVWGVNIPTNSNPSINIGQCQYVQLKSFMASVAVAGYGVRSYFSNLEMLSGFIDLKEAGIYGYGGQIFGKNMTGTTNDIGAQLNNCVMFRTGTLLSGTTSSVVANGAQIFE